MNQALIHELVTAEAKAIDSLARYKFAMFGYWAGIWVHLNRITGENRPNPFKELVTVARKLRGHKQDSVPPNTTYSGQESQVHSPVIELACLFYSYKTPQTLFGFIAMMNS